MTCPSTNQPGWQEQIAERSYHRMCLALVHGTSGMHTLNSLPEQHLTARHGREARAQDGHQRSDVTVAAALRGKRLQQRQCCCENPTGHGGQARARGLVSAAPSEHLRQDGAKRAQANCWAVGRPSCPAADGRGCAGGRRLALAGAAGGLPIALAQVG